ncbi:peptidyl-prolyl cis-trans isomerase [Sphingosinicella sp. CPCC 101087]|uniref:peptidyl-prolyl cis-trans isomerase n=1 Tax=Sphingosinicella sp. CPCC 101087 TaxID=2497754 RepID=UPI00101D07F5|nr:peptidyl-prolyl cis-trans isomerase [Sphingosinicella sp. CPCC 101087]
MLAAVRRSVRSWAAAAILFIALLALVVTGFGTGGLGGLGGIAGGASGETLATAGGRELTETEVTDVVTREFSRARLEQPELGMVQFVTSSFMPIVDQLVLALAVQAFGVDQGLVVSETMIDREIVNIPAFRDAAGRFDQNIFRQQLSAQNLTEAQIREDIRRSLMQRQLLGPVARGTTVPESVAREYANLLLERRRGSIGVVPAELLREGIAPTDAEVAAFYQSNLARFTIPERRVIRYAMIGPEQVAQAVEPTDAEIAEHYRQNAATYGPRETRDLQSIVLPDQAAAQAFAQRVRGGASFAEAAAQAGFSATDVALSDQTRDAFAGVTSPAVAQAAFSAEQGALVGPVRSPLGFHLVQVEAIERTAGRPIETVRDEIAAAVRQRKLVDALGGLIARVEEQLAQGASIEQAAAAERLQLVTTPPVTETGQAPGQQWQPPVGFQPVLRSAFEMDPEDPEPMIEQIEPNQLFALVGVENVVAAAPPPLAQIRDQVRAILIQQRAIERARAIAQQIVTRINGGMAPAEAFAQAQPSMPSPQSVDMRRLEISQGGEQAPPPLIALFSLPQGRAHLMAAPNGQGWFVVHHAERTPGDAAEQPELIASTRTEFTSSSAAEVAEQFARALERAVEVERNAEAIQRVRQRLIGSVAP